MGKLKKIAICVALGLVAVGVLAATHPSVQAGDRAHPSVQAGDRAHVDRLNHRSVHGKIAVKARGKHFSGDAKVSFARTRSEKAKGRVVDGLAKNWRGRHGGKKAFRTPRVFAMYDVSITDGGRKWQPKSGEPVRVEMELDEPVAVTAASSLRVVHVANDGDVEELDASRYGFTYSADKTAVTAFWFNATGFSIYAIVDGADHTVDSDPARRLYDFYSRDFDTNSPTWNQYVPRYFKTIEGNYTFRQIVKDGQMLVRPEVLPSPLGRTFTGWHLYDPNKANAEGYDAEGYAIEKFDFESPVVFDEGETGEHEYVLRAVFDRVGYVIFHEQPSGDDWPITAVRRGIMHEVETNIVVEAGVEKTNITMQASVPIGDVTVTYDDTSEREPGEEEHNTTPRMIFRGWSMVKVMPGAVTNVLGGEIELLGTNYVFRRTKDTEAVPRDLFPVFVNINWLAFSSGETGQGATYIPPRFFYADEGTNRFPVPSRTGYAFDGWYTSTNAATRVKVADAGGNLVSTVTTADLDGWGGKIENGKLMLTADATFHAKWSAAPTKYTIVIWQQKATDAANLPDGEKTYDFYESFTNMAQSTTSVSVPETYKSYSTMTNFHYARCDGTKVVNGNGSTVFNVYYDRNVHTLAFFSSGTVNIKYGNGNNSNGTLGDRVTSATTISTLEGLGSDNKKTISGYEVAKNGSSYYIKIGTSWYQISSKGSNVYGASSISISALAHYETGLAGSVVSDIFPISGYTAKTWVGDVMYTERLASFELMPDTDIKFTLSSNTGNGGTIRYYVEVGSQAEMGSDGEAKDGKYYKLYKSTVHDYNYLTENEDFHELEGYTKSSSDCTFSGGRYPGSGNITKGTVNKFYYDRKSQTIEFKDSYDQAVLKEINVGFSDEIGGHVPTNAPASSRPGYSFTGWYVDEACSTRAYFDADEFAAATSVSNKMLYTTMPSHNLQFFAGWETVWYLIEIDPNGGELMFVEEGSAANQSTFFWEPYNGDPIIEYSTVTRSFEESALYGTFFYAMKDRKYYNLTDEWEPREDDIKSRRAYYTTSQSDDARVDDRLYRQAQNVYRYAGWYEQKEDGTEELYAFGQPVQHNTKLKLHWKHLGKYHLHYDPGVGQVSMGDENETILETLDASVYADSSEILITRTATPPDGYTFAGWRIRYGDDTVYHPGQTFIFDSAYTRDVPGADGKTVHQLVLDAVYSVVRTVSLTTDANGGTLDGSVATTLPLAYPNAPSLITNITETTRTVSGMRNNAYGHLSDGAGYSCVIDGVPLVFLGWNTAADGTGTHFDGGQYIGVDTLDTPDENGHNVLYAEWGVTVYFDKNNAAADWNASAWPSNCVWDAEKGLFCQTNKLNGCATDPAVPLTSSNDNEMFRYWGIKRYSGEIEPYDFSQPITNASISLFAVWSNRIEVAVHAVDSANGTFANKDAEWVAADNDAIVMDASTYVSFEADSAGYATPPSGYAFAFACLCDGKNGHAAVSEEMSITNVYYNVGAQQVYVTYADGNSEPLPDDKEIYFVYFQSPKTLEIGYKAMEMDGSLVDASVRNTVERTAPVGDDDAGAYDVAAHLTTPMGYLSGESLDNYAYAIGEPDATGVLQLHLITSTSGSDTARPALRIKNTWRGYQYSRDGGETWIGYGYNAQLYVVYFNYQPVIVSLNEKTLGTASDMAEQFSYSVVVAQTTVTNTTPRQYRTRTWNNGMFGLGAKWGDWGNPQNISNGRTVSTTHTVNLLETTCTLADGQQEAFAVFSDDDGYTTDWMPTYGTSHTSGVNTQYQTNYTVTVVVRETITITQTPKSGFTTTNDGAGGDQKYVYIYTTTGDDDESDQSVTFTNTHTAEPVEIHVAMGQNGVLSNHDDQRTGNAGAYTLTVTNGADNAVSFAGGVPEGFFTGDASRYRFMGIFYARTNENGVVVSIGTDPVTSVAFAPMGENGYFGLYFDGDPENAVGDWELYAVYAEIPRIYYVKEGANGALTQIAPLTYVGEPLTNMGFGDTTVAQGTDIDVGAGSVVSVATSAGVGKFNVPKLLDSVYEGLRMTKSSFAAGPVDAVNMSAMDGVTDEATLQLKTVDGVLKWSTDGESWNEFSGSPAVYVIYKEPGFDLTFVKSSLAADADKAADSFVVTISSANLPNGVTYVVSGYSTEELSPVNGVITLSSITNGSRVTIHALPDDPNLEVNRQYAILEQPAADYTLTNILINGFAPSKTVANGVETILSENKTVEFTNIKSYTVTFTDENGTEISSAKHPYGTPPSSLTAGVEAPAKAMDETNIYRFDDWSPSVEPVGSNTTYTAQYNEIKIPQVVQRSADTNLVVMLDGDDAQAREEALIQALNDAGIDILDPNYSESAASDMLNSIDPNGFRRWENLVTGTDPNQVPLGTGSADGTHLAVRIEPPAGDKLDLGYAVLYDLRRNVDHGWTRIDGPKASELDLSLRLLDDSGKSVGAAGFYRVFTLLVPNHELSVTNELPATNIIGVLEVDSTSTNTMTAVPWSALAHDPNVVSNVVVSDYMKPAQLAVGDTLHAITDDGVYQKYTIDSSGNWVNAAATITRSGSVVTPPAEERELHRGDSVWVTRNDTSKPYFLVGQYSGENIQVSVAGSDGTTAVPTMITNPRLSALAINDIDWGGNPSANDVIWIPSENGISTTLRWTKDSADGKMKWGVLVQNRAKRTSYLKSDWTVPSGMGFWYNRKGAAFTVTVPVDKVSE